MSTVEKSRISASVDYDKAGKQYGYLSIPHSRDDSAWGSLRMPIAVISNGDGPTVLFTGGNHGDEYEGPIAIMKLARELEAGAVEGRVILIPALNFPAVCS
ncbi:MAG: succinylglutamate desuccinylase/aspartoacylase family protein, partial [Gammaproteobacteria bacterium]|nr:succinylglutamate desuccinylase/aspartoacylase family protein [Gammaproteobacteria bacterium]